jgi:hypothetical protein
MTPLRQRMIDDMQLTSFAETGRLHPDCTLDRDWPPFLDAAS